MQQHDTIERGDWVIEVITDEDGSTSYYYEDVDIVSFFPWQGRFRVDGAWNSSHNYFETISEARKYAERLAFLTANAMDEDERLFTA